jgi:hypothetical protein
VTVPRAAAAAPHIDAQFLANAPNIAGTGSSAITRPPSPTRDANLALASPMFAPTSITDPPRALDPSASPS